MTVFPEAIGLAIGRLVEQLIAKGHPRDHREYLVMVDGEVQVPRNIPMELRRIVDGDKHVWQIGAASIIAKVERDHQMTLLDKQYPQYQWAQNKGYPTKGHKALMHAHGPCEEHRHTFKPVALAKGTRPGFEF